jgi:RNA-directed DNA polymerase
VTRLESPQPGGGGGQRGLPTVLDRFVPPAGLQVLQPRWDRPGSEGSEGCRPGRLAHRAGAQAQRYWRAGSSGVVDLDLETCLDRVHRDTLRRLGKERGAERRGLKRIDRSLKAGALTDEGLQATGEGTPQGGAVSPL